jgi:hypothetical protein
MSRANRLLLCFVPALLVLVLCCAFFVGHESAQTGLTSVPAGSTISVSVSAKSPSGAALSYRWLPTDGTVPNANTPTSSPSTTWTLPSGQGLHFLYVLVSDSQGGYTERRIAIFTTDPNAAYPAVVSGTPLPPIPPVPPSPVPLATIRGWVQDQRPGISMQLVNEYTGTPFGPVITDNQGQFAFHNLPPGNYVPYIADAPGQPLRVAGDVNPSGSWGLGGNSAFSDYDGGGTYWPDRIGNTVISGKVTLADGSVCGDSSEFFGLHVNAVATLYDNTNTAASLPAPVNIFGTYEIDARLAKTGTYSVQIACEQAPVQTAPVSVVLAPYQTELYPGVNATIPSTPPAVSGFTATLNGTPITLATAAAATLPSNSVPRANQFLSTKGVDTRMGACLYYVAVGAATSCDATGAPIGGITFDAWKKSSGLAPYNTTPEASASYVNEVDLNLTRNHHGIQTANGVAMYVCNYVGPADDTNQAEIDAAVANASTATNQNLVACVAMDYLTSPTNPNVNGGVPFTRFLTFGPSGNLLLSVNLDGRGEKFVPGTCVACHGAENYAGSYPTDGTGTSNIGAHFLPFDTGNFVFSSQTGLQLANQSAQIYALNQLVLQTNATTSAQALINAWYQPAGSTTEDNSYVAGAWVNATDPNIPNMYSGVIKHSCRTCHVAQVGQWDIDGGGLSDGVVYSVCGGINLPYVNHSMPNSKVTFDRMWNSQGSGTGTDQIAYITAWLNDISGSTTLAANCSYSTPDPPITYGANTWNAPSCNYSFSPQLLSLSGAAQTATVTVTANNPLCSVYLYTQDFTVPGTAVDDPAPVLSPVSGTQFNPNTTGTPITVTVTANPDGATRYSGLSFNDSLSGTFPVGISQSALLTGAPQTLTFAPLSSVAFGSAPIALTAWSTSSLPVSLLSSTTSVCTLAGSTLTLVRAGTCTITASQSGNASYAAATPVVQSFQVTAGSPTITFDSIPTQFLGTPPFVISAHTSTALPVGFVSNTPLVCKTAGGLVSLLGTGTCTIKASQGSLSATLSFTVETAHPSGSFAPALGSPVLATTNPTAAVVADFNGDGFQDIATVDNGTNLVAVLLGNGAGGFTQAPGSPFALGIFVSNPNTSIVAGDFNGDGHPDLAAANYGSNEIMILLGDGAGGFSGTAVLSPCTAGALPISLAVGDFNGDGTEDLAAACDGGNNVAILLGNGSGSFAPAAGSPFALGGNPRSIAVGDFNGDGIEDIATANYTTSNLSVLLGNSSGGFTAASGSPYAAGSNPASVVVGDFSGGGTQDLAVANYGTNNVAVLLGNGTGTFTTASGSPFAVGTSPDSLAVEDFNGDGIPDLAVANSGDNTITILLGSGSGGFTPAPGSPFATGSVPTSVVVADFNGDGVEDLATANHGGGSLSVLLGTPPASTPTFSPAAGTYTSAQTVTISDSTTGATIYFTTNGTTPTTSSTVYRAPITASATETVEAIAVASEFSQSAVATAAYTITPPAATPTFSPAAGTYTSAQTVTISDTTAGATIYYTTNGTPPTTSSTKYAAPITVSATETIEALAVATGFSQSAVGTAAYTITSPAATPTFSPGAGTYTSAQGVTISDTTTGATIYYTTNGTTPTTSSTKYAAPITVSATETIKAIAVATGYSQSAVGTAAYTITPLAATPTFSPAAGTYASAQTVSISDATTGATIYYTTNGTTPTTSSTRYAAPITVSATETIEAIAVATGFSQSAVGTSAYTITPPAATPTFSPAAGTYTSAQTVTISDTTTGATIYYTTNGTTPTTSSTRYTAPIKVSTTETIEAIAVATGYSQSAVATAAYTISTQAATPTFSPAAGTYTSAQTVTISDSTTGATIYYTTNGTTPTTSSTRYTAPITVSATETIEAIAVATGYSQSAVGTAAYTITPPAATPTFSPAAGTYTTAQSVTISDATTGATIYYTTNGTTPTTSSTRYTAPITVSATETIEAIAVAAGFSQSAVGTAAYTLSTQAATPTFSPAAGTYNSTQTVTISDTTAGATIYYTTNGTTPTTSSTRYTAPITVSATETIEAIAVATGFSQSAVGTAAYTLSTQAATPTFSPAAGTYNSTQNVTISDTTRRATIYFTTDGTTPTTSSTRYTAPITVSTTETIEAIAVATGYSQSAAGTAAYTISTQAAAPTFSPAAGAYNSPQTVTISDTTAGATIYYTTNGSTPTTTSTKYTAPITVSSTETIKAIAAATGLSQSSIASSTYTLVSATPVTSPAGGAYSSAQTVTITDSTPGAIIYYTTNGTTPTTSSTKYTAPITVSATETVEAIAVANGFSQSAVGTAAYTISTQAATPTFSPAAGTYTSTQTVTISDNTPGATIYYTTNGTAPTTSSTKYTAPITVSATETVEAIAVATGYSQSAAGTAAYTISTQAATPTFSPAAGTYTSAQTITISDTTRRATIYYTTNGTTPTTSSTRYTAPITVSATETIEAIAVSTGLAQSAVGTSAYTIP